MFSLKSNEHFFRMVKELYEDEVFSDIIFITENGFFYGHSHLIFRHIPTLTDLVCDGCRSGHEKLTIFLPQVRPEFLEIALIDLYCKGDVNSLSVKKEILEDTNEFKIENNLPATDKFVSVIQYSAGSKKKDN